ncbi:MAG TPA: sulfotransferase domain-containing protein [Actinomycetales bacterium]|nr:sulfotransferase domain-containing protein [Actinomycetales bacterium]
MSLDRKSIPVPLRRAGRAAATAFGTATAGLRVEPDFLVVGAQRCGTTSLFRALLSHPNVMRANLHKGVNYFDVNYQRGSDWYLSHFPLRATARRRAADGAERAQVFDSSGYYMFHPHAPDRIAADLPGVKIVAMVRDPVERAFSAYKHEFARGFETEPLDRALALEDERIEPELARMKADPEYQSQVYRHQAYRRRGHYAEQLRRFADLLSREQVHVVASERFFSEPEEEYGRLLEFLGLPRVMPASFDRYNPRPSAPLDPAIQAQLRRHFEPYDADLEEFSGARPAWL